MKYLSIALLLATIGCAPNTDDADKGSGSEDGVGGAMRERRK